MTKSLSSRCRDFFEGAITARGRACFDAGKVLSVRHSELGSEILVRGTRKYVVTLTLDESGDEVSLACDCPYFAQGAGCKHLWAAVLKLDSAGLPEMYRRELDIRLTDPGTDEESEDIPGPVWRGTHHPLRRDWRTTVSQIGDDAAASAPHTRAGMSRRALFVLSPGQSSYRRELVFEVWRQERRKDGSYTKARPARLDRRDVESYEAPDREILDLLISSGRTSDRSGFAKGVTLTGKIAEIVLPRMIATGRAHASVEKMQTARPLVLGEHGPLRCELRMREQKRHLHLAASLKTKTQSFDVSDVELITDDGWLLLGDDLYRLDFPRHVPWLEAVHSSAIPPIPIKEGREFLARYFEQTQAPPIALPESLGITQLRTEPRWRIRLEFRDDATVGVVLGFLYGETEILALNPGSQFFDAKSGCLVVRDAARESDVLAKLGALAHLEQGDSGFVFPAAKFVEVADALLAWGWDVSVQNRRLRKASSFEVAVSSHIDWFELRADAHFGDERLSLPELLARRKEHEHLVALGDGTWGILPNQWLAQYAPLAAMGQVESDHLRFDEVQGILMDAWLQEKQIVDPGGDLLKFRERILTLQSAGAQEPPAAFRGELRPYQKVGLGWLHRLAAAGFGGILADDMGLGKTVQCLAYLLTRSRKAPSLVVAPKSLIFNWRDEAARFAPSLRVLDYTGPARHEHLARFAEYDLILTNYPTVRLDIAELKEFEFDCVILDEAQTIKNADALTAKACRLLRGDFRLALTGTPIENSLADLFSLTDFVIPGLLGASTKQTFLSMMQAGSGKSETLAPLARALHPFIMRRTKGLVATDLPSRSEQDLHVEPSEKELSEYRELRDYYRAKLLKDDAPEKKQNRIFVLEALLRLRQLACHPGLVDPERRGETSSKLALLLERLEAVMGEGHKVLVFSQFTKFLQIVREHLELRGLPFEYLDGKTGDRQAKVRSFQESAGAKVFLISLKAGGVGLNLTAADYVYILDPWWNPAVEAQAIDRTHRIGQTKRVMAYRLITTGTVEEKVLALQSHKKGIAEAIISADGSFLQKLTAQDLDVLLQ